MIELLITTSDVEAVRQQLVGDDVETCAVLYANEVTRPGGRIKLLVHTVEYLAPEDYTRRGPVEAELNPACVARVTKRARVSNSCLVFAHSHPGPLPPHFSAVDGAGERHLERFLAFRNPSLTHAALVISAGGMMARQLGTNNYIRVISVGSSRDVLYDANEAARVEVEVFDRQIRAFGAEGQRALQRLRVGVVGAGGIGSIVIQQLAHLGVREFVLIDADTLEESNLNRVANARPSDLGTPKVQIAQRYIESIAEDAVIKALVEDVTLARVARHLTTADVIFGCTDSHGSRAVLQQVAYQYLIPCIDTGTIISVDEGVIKHVYGRVQLLSPGHACLTCSGLLNANEVRRDMMTPFERQADPYLRGAREPAPAVMSLNGTVASLAVTMVLSMVAGVPVWARYLFYNAMASTLRAVQAQPDPLCYICSPVGSLAKGDSWPLLARQD